jgi:hypothetical protein
MECPNCAFQNMPGLSACVRCRGLLDFSAVDIEPPRAHHGRWLRRLGSMRSTAAQQTLSLARSVRLPARMQVTCCDLAWSIIPGLAQIRRGERILGRVLLCAWLTVLLLALALMGGNLSLLLCLFAVSVHCLAVSLLLNSVLAAMPIVRRAALGLLMYAGVLFFLYRPVQALGQHAFRALEISNVKPSSWIDNGDVLLYTGSWTRPAVFERGDLVIYEIESSAAAGAIVRAGLGVERVLGIPGDEVRTDGKTLWVNGIEQPAAQWPVGGLRSMPAVSVTAGDGEYIIFPTALRWTAHGNVEGVVSRMMDSIAHVRQDRIRGQVFWRVRPWSRAGVPGAEAAP